jgi:hypothetical protein
VSGYGVVITPEPAGRKRTTPSGSTSSRMDKHKVGGSLSGIKMLISRGGAKAAGNRAGRRLSPAGRATRTTL